MKIQVEINYVDDGRVFLNYWNWRNGNDVCCEIVDGKLIHDYEVDGKDTHEEITLQEFITMVKNRN